ncbi:MAG: hypothetical protein JSV62_05500 [Promethearchaeota archaeon]|nr:MAG: hypothetical protein JSV62_05500 [Candidatus Lokiarchaeota archaeon]
MYCPNCNMNVYTRKNDFNIGLAIFLAIFTGGIGLLIYVAIYLDREHKPRCIHCNNVCYEQKEEINQPVSNYQVVSNSNQIQNQSLIIKSQNSEEKPKFCYNCGSELDGSENAKFCALCGSSLQ